MGVAICIAAVVILIFWQVWGKPTATQNNTTPTDNTQKISTPLFINEYTVLVELTGASNTGGNELRIINSDTRETRKTFFAISPSILHSFIWDQKSSRIYFSSTAISNKDTTFFFIDLNDPDPNAVTEIVYNPSGRVNGKLDIIGSDNGTIYFVVDRKLYSLDVEKGMSASPVLIKQLD